MKKIFTLLILVIGFYSTAQAASAKAYCWGWHGSYDKKAYYSCYGPEQRLSTGYEDLNEALDLVNCDTPDYNRHHRFGEGKRGGIWFRCSNKLRSYDNSPSKIKRWVNKQ